MKTLLKQLLAALESSFPIGGTSCNNDVADAAHKRHSDAKKAAQAALDAPEPEPKYSKQQYDQLHAVAYNRYVERNLLRKKLASLGESNACRDIEKQAKLISQGSSEVEPRESGSVVGSNPIPNPLSDEAICALWDNASDSYAFARAIESAVLEKLK